MEFCHESEVQSLLKEIAMIKTRITKLLLQARQGLTTIKDTKGELVRQTKEMEEQKQKIAKLDHWLEEINNELKESTQQLTTFTENDIIRYIEVYERYIREYEEYEGLINSIIVVIRDDSSQLKQNLNTSMKTLKETKSLVILEILKLRQMLIQIKNDTGLLEDDLSQTDRTIDSTSMPEEIVSPREPDNQELNINKSVIEKIESNGGSRDESEPTPGPNKQMKEIKISKEVQFKPQATTETQTGKSLISEAPSVIDRSVICKPDQKILHDVSVTCAPPQDVEVQTSEIKSLDKETHENIQVTQTISDGHETIEIASRPVRRDQKINEQSLLIDAQYKDDNIYKDSTLNITHSLPQSFETVMVEPDETTTEVVVDADGTKRIIVKKVRKTLVTRQQIIQPQPTTSSDIIIPPDQSFSQLMLKEDTGSSSRLLDDGSTRYVQYQTCDGKVISGLPGSEVTIQEFTSHPDMVIKMEQGMKPEEILQLAEGETPCHVQTSSSSVTAVVQQVTKRIIKTKRRIIRRVVIIDGKEHVTEEVIEEPDNVEVYEEQIPRVSINVRDSVVVEDDKDNQNKPSFPPSSRKGDKHHDLDKDIKKEDEQNFEDKYQKQTRESYSGNIPNLQTLTKEFLQKESDDRNASLKNVSASEKNNKLTGDEASLISSDMHSTLETSTANIATVVQKVIKKVTRIRKRIIKHIKIIDGKEHVTEEVIEEPEEVEIIDNEPNVSQIFHEQGETQTKRIKIIRQVNIIDGKEHVTEQVVEEPDDFEVISESNNDPSYKLNITELVDPEIPVNTTDVSKHVETQDKNIVKLTKDLIKSEVDHSKVVHTPGKKDEKEIRIETEQIVEDPDDVDNFENVIIPSHKLDITELNEKESPNDRTKDSRDIETQNKNMKDLAKDWIENEIKKSKLQQHVNVLEEQKNVENNQEILALPESTETSKIDTFKQTHTRTTLTRTRKRIIKHIQIIDGKEHVSEEVIEEPDDMEIIEDTPIVSHVVQEGGTRTKRIKIIRQIQIINGKEHVTEQIIEDPDDEYVAESTVTASVDVQMSKPDVTQLKKNKILIEQTSKVPDNENSTSAVNITEELIRSEMLRTKELQKSDQEKEKVISTEKPLSIDLDAEPLLPRQSEETENIAHSKEITTGTAKLTLESTDKPIQSTIKLNVGILTEDQKSSDISRKLIESESNHSTILRLSQKTSITEVEQKLNLDEKQDVNKRDNCKQDVSSKIIDDITTDKTNIKSVNNLTGVTGSNITDSPMTQKPITDSGEIALRKPQDMEPDTKAKSPIDHATETKDDKQTMLEIGVQDHTKQILADLEEHHPDSTAIPEYVKSVALEVEQKKEKSPIVESKNLFESEALNKNINNMSALEHEHKVSVDLDKLLKSEQGDHDQSPIVTSLEEKLNIEIKDPIRNDLILHDKSKFDSPKDQSLVESTNKFIEIEAEHSHILPKETVEEPKSLETTEDIPSKLHLEEDKKLTQPEPNVKTDKTIADIIPTDKSPQGVQTFVPGLEESTQNIIKTTTRTRIIRHVQIINGKEYVTEEVVEEPGEVEILQENTNLPLSIQEEGVKTKQIKIIRQVNIIDGKKHVTEKIIEDSDNEYIPETTIKANINLQLTDSNITTNKPDEQTPEIPKSKEFVQDTSKAVESDVTETIPKESTDDDIIKVDTENVTKQKEKKKVFDKEQGELFTHPSNYAIAPEEFPLNVKSVTAGFLTEEIVKNSELLKESNIKKSVDDIFNQEKGIKEEFKGPVSTSQLPKVNVTLPSDIQVENSMKPLYPLSQSSVKVEPVEAETVISEIDINAECREPKISYIKQFQPPSPESPEALEKVMLSPVSKENIDIVSAPTKLNTKHDIVAFIESERLSTDTSVFQHVDPIKNENQIDDYTDKSLQTSQLKRDFENNDSEYNPSQTVDMVMSLSKIDKDKKYEPKIEVDIKIEEFETNTPSIVKKDIRADLPAEITVINEQLKKEVCDIIEENVTDPLLILEESNKDDQHTEPDINEPSIKTNDFIHTESNIETDKSIEGTESSSLSHYVKLETPPLNESPKPSQSLLEVAVVPKDVNDEPLSASTDVEVITEKGYEPEDVSLHKSPALEKKRKHKKRKSHAISEETAYPKQTTTDEDTEISTPVEMEEPICHRKIKTKKGKKKTPVSDKFPEDLTVTASEPKSESPKVGTEMATASPQEESYHTISETSDINTVKIVEECIGSSPEIIQKEVATTVTYPVPIVEEIAINEYSVQTSPEVLEVEKEDIVGTSKTEMIDTELQTSPTPVTEILTQTTPVEDIEVHTQTLDDIKIVDKVDVLDSQIQTSRTESPEELMRTEVTTQVVSRDIVSPDDKFSQTSSPVNDVDKIVEKDCRGIQTSPLPQVQKDEKSTEIVIETTESDIQTVRQNVVDQETSTSPIKVKELIEMSIQTPEIPLVDTYTQSDLSIGDKETYKQESPSLPEDVTCKALTIDKTQQTTPRNEDVEIKSAINTSQKEITMIDNVQQTSPRIESNITTPTSPLEFIKKDLITVDDAQQTTPRDYKAEDRFLSPVQYSNKDDIKTIDGTQQTSPRDYSEDSVSTSTDEPYEIHLRAQISIPRSTHDFIENERQSEQIAQPIKDHKQKKRKPKKKTESPLPSPSSLSDPINAELSFSVTPTSEDLSSKESSSIDEGISQLTSPIQPNQQEMYITAQKPTYSDVVQRSKSKSPSPSKTIFRPKVGKARLINTLEKRTQYLSEPQKISENALTVALIEPSVEKSYDLIVNKELEDIKSAIKNNDPVKIEKSIIVVIETISIWLEEIQYRIQRQAIEGDKSSNESERVKALENYVKGLREIIYVTEVNEEIITLIETITRQIHTISYYKNKTTEKVKEEEKEWNKFLSDIEVLDSSVDKLKSTLDELIMSENPMQKKLENLDEIEKDNVYNLDFTKKLFQIYRNFMEINPKRECPAKLFAIDESTKQIENTINTERDRLLQLTSLAEEYEQTLQDFGQITDVAEALLDGKIIVSNLDHLYEEIQKHRKFFINLSHCRAILESLENNLDTETRTKYSALHHSLHDRATLIIDRAAGRAQQMTLAASRWSVLDQSMKEEQQWLRVAQQRIPDLSNVTSIDHEQYINLYQSISLDASQHYAKMLRLLSITEGLQNLIVCSGLETECSVSLDTLLKLQEDIDSRLTRLTAFKENWVTYDNLIDRIENWMKLANKELEHITPENITTTSNLRRFWELKAQHEVHNNLKNESGVQFEKALEILPISDEMVQRQFFSKIEDEWRDLSSRICHIHTSAIKNISDRDVPSSEKLNILEDEMRELRAMLDALKGVIKSDDELNLYIERLQVMTSRIDRIQNELGRLSLLPTAESERLGALLTQSGVLDDQIAEELERSMLLKEKIVQVQAGIARCQKSQRRAQLTLEECEAADRLGSDVVERASQTCEKLIEDLSTQWRDILALRQALHTLPTALRVCVSPISLERDISALQDTHAELEAACNELSVRLRSKVQLWRRFERQLELVQGAVREADYMVELLTVQGQVDYDRLLKATEKLETLSDSLSRRSGELVGSLREAAAPLESSCEPSIAAKLRKELDDAAAAYEHTCSNLTQLCDKYHKAVELWRRYREAAACVRAFADQHEGTLHALRPHDAPAAAQACLEQEARVAELRSLAARVAAETGSRALQADADALARRLQLVAGAVQALADLGEARQLARAKAQHAKEMFCDMRQDLTPVQEDGEIVEDKLIALRENLIALGKSEADIAPAKAELPDIDRDVSDEHSIVRILELWQAMFRDTFLHYHRLSTALVRSGDAATALRLWNEYLLDLQSFLSGSVPADYENLTEHRRLCRVHRNLLASQRSVLMNENKESKNRDLADKFDTLTNLHNETLARIVERHDEVCTRIAAWDEYLQVYTELLRWLKEIEREKEKLQLRYVHIKTIHKVLSKIQNLADKLPEGRKFSEKLLDNLKKVMEFTEETYSASVRMEYAGIVKRVDNLQASLDTWRDFLTRILGLIGEYETLTDDLHKLYSKTQSEVTTYSDDDRLSRPQLKKAIDKYTDLRTKIDKTETKLEALSVIQEQLKECLSPQDIRIVNQKVWQLRQQRADLEHQLSIIIHRLQERLEIYTIFDSRLSRFSEWIRTLESRLETTTSSSDLGALDPQDLVRRINSDIQAETSLKEREFEWLAETGSVLTDLAKKDEKSYSKNTSKLLKDIQERWHNLQETGRNRIAKINELLDTISQLEERLTEIRLKLHTIESNLSAPVVLEHLTTKAVDTKFQERDEIHKNIENESGEVGKTLNLCELVFNDADVLKGNYDLRNLHTGVNIVEKKWKNICDMSEQRKKALKEVRKSAELAISLLPKVEKKLDGIEKRVEKIETRKQRGEAEDETVSKAVIKDLDTLEGDVKKLEDAYSRIASARGVEVRGSGADDAARLRAAVRRWQQLRCRVDAAGADAHRQFVAAHGKAVVALAETDVRLTRALHLAPIPSDKAATLKELDEVEKELRECEALVDEADRLSVSVASVSGVSDMVGEYRALFADVRTRLDLARAEVVGDVDTAVQVDTLKWETDAALQVDTLTSKETYRVELASAVKETSESLEALRTALLQEIKENTGSEELATAAKEIAKAGSKPEQTLELAKHLSELLLTECDATEEEAMLKEVESLSLRYEDLLTQAKKRELKINNLRLPHSASYALTCEHETGRVTCPLCSDRNWKQLDNDLWRLEQWLQFAEATDEAHSEPPEQYDALEDAIQDHREFLLDLDSHKALVVSLNVVGAHVTRHARRAADAARARERLAAANARWDGACARAAAWQAALQHALLHNAQFHDIVVELVEQLAAAERTVRAREPLRLARPPNELRDDFRRFSELRDELSRAEPRVLALRDAAQLLKADAQHVCRRLGELRLRLQSLRKLSGVYALKLGAALARSPQHSSALAAAAASATAATTQLLEEDEQQLPAMTLPPLDDADALSEERERRELSGVRRGLRFVCRVARASLPFQALLLLLLGAAALAPLAPPDCRPAPSLQPVLRYPHGPPPL